MCEEPTAAGSCRARLVVDDDTAASSLAADLGGGTPDGGDAPKIQPIKPMTLRASCGKTDAMFMASIMSAKVLRPMNMPISPWSTMAPERMTHRVAGRQIKKGNESSKPRVK